MENRIHIQNIVANYFEHNPEKDRVSLEIICNIGNELMKELRAKNPSAYLANHWNDVINMINTSPEIFEQDDDTKEIVLKNRPLLEKEVPLFFNAKLDSAIKETYFQLMETLCQRD